MTSLRIAVFTSLLFAAPLHAIVRLGNDVVPVRQSVTFAADPRAANYRGSVRIELDVKKPVQMFRLHSKGSTIEKLTLTQNDAPVAITHAPGADDTLEITAASALQVGRALLSIDFTNPYTRPESGFSKVQPKSGEPMVVTDFEPVDARSIFPCFDEPGFKIPWDVAVEIPAEFDAVSNSPIASESRNGNTRILRFKPTKPLPSYLVTVVIGQFDYTEVPGTSIPVRIVSPKGQGRLTGFAAEVTPRIVRALEQFFSTKYPFEKLDLIAVPEFNHAMENAGAITFGDRYISLDPASVTPVQKSFLIKLIAHETSHMWFGDLVTMEWWDDVWLNEAFADWLGDKIAREQFPESASELAELSAVQGAMTTDARPATDSTRTKNIDPNLVFSNYSTIYLKGKAVLSMFETWIGVDRFRLGVLDHIRSHAGGNAAADDFFAALGRHAPPSTAAAFQSFVDLPGIPLVTVDRAGPSAIVLKQSRFTTSSATAMKSRLWKIPISIRYSDGEKTRTTSVLLDTATKTVNLEGQHVDWLFPDAGATGYYRWTVPPEWLESTALSPTERLALIGNAGALLRNGTMHGDAYLDLLGQFANDTSPEVLQALFNALTDLRLPFETAETQPRLSAYYRRILHPAVETIGFAPKPGESLAITSLRPDLLVFLGVFAGDDAVRQFAREQLAKYQKDPASIDASLVDPILTISADRGDEALFEDIRKRFEAAASPNDRRMFARVLGRFHDSAMKKKARAYALTAAVKWNETMPVAGLPISDKERDDFYQWATSNYDEMTKRYNPSILSTLPFVAEGCEPDRIAAAKKFFAANKVDGTDRQLERSAEQVSECAALRARELAFVTKALSRPPL